MKKTVTSIDEQILRASKEIIVKFIEVGRVSPSGFGESFRDIYRAIDAAVKGAQDPDQGVQTTGEQAPPEA
ncbi:hypothetical protein JCM14469_27760 [Desulfatiferula olefinivorans]